MSFETEASKFNDPEKMANAYLEKYYGKRKIEYPINPFQMLVDEGILFSLRNFNNLEGVYIPASGSDDIPVVGININRPITRQRFTAAHELCHHFRDAGKQISCPIGGRNAIEKFAECFAAALLMPKKELTKQVNKRRTDFGFISLDDVLDISVYFGVSFQACFYRIYYNIDSALDIKDTDEPKKIIKQYQPEKKRKCQHLTYVKLYEGLIDCCQDLMSFVPSDHARYVFQNEYIYNDSRMEGIDITLEEASEIVTDLRLKTQNSNYCNQDNEAFLSIAGHYDMYQHIFTDPHDKPIDIYDLLKLNKLLFSHYPYPEFGGKIRQSNSLVMGSKFEAVDYHEIYDELGKLYNQVKDFFLRRKNISISEYVKHVARIHYQITVIHPFTDGNGRTSRAFMNEQLLSAGIVPIYVKAKDKKEYISALSRADQFNDFNELYEVVFRLIVRSYGDLC